MELSKVDLSSGDEILANDLIEPHHEVIRVASLNTIYHVQIHCFTIELKASSLEIMRKIPYLWAGVSVL